MTPEIFAPGIISTGYHDGCITFSPDGNDLYPTLSRTGNLYFASDRDGGWDIYVSKYKNDEYAKPQKLSNAINSEFGDWDVCLALDESYILFGSNGRSDG